jgi:flagellar biosynthesis protein FlhG
MEQVLEWRKIKDKDIHKGIAENRLTSPKTEGVRVIAVTSGKGGVGKTSLTVNLAFWLQKMKKKVLLLDADMGLANIDVILGLTPQFNLYHVLRGEKSFSEAAVIGPGGMIVLPAASGIVEMADLSAGHKMTLLNVLDDFRGEIDYMMIDTAAGIAGNVTYFNAAAKEIIVVVSPEPTSLTDAYALIKVLYQRHAKRSFRLIVNMAKHQVEAREIYQRLSKATERFLDLNVDYLGYVAHDEKLAESVCMQKIVGELYPSSLASSCIRRIAQKIAEEHPIYEDDGNIAFS